MLLDDDPEKRPPRPWVKALLIVGGLVVLGGAGTALVMGMLKDSSGTRKKVVQEISLLRPPPPPPPPKQEEKPPEPEIKKEEVKLPDEKPEEPQQADQPPPGEQLSVDGQGSSTGDSFGLGAKPGGRDITTIGGDKFGWYAGVLRAQIQKLLQRDERLQGSEFKVVVRVWMEVDGSVRRAELVDSTGDLNKDKRIQLALAQMPALKEVPPENMPQPIRFRLSSKL